MATLEGGIFSRPRGKTGGIVFGAARTRQGKLVTSRLLVSPSNPNTPAQQTQRNVFSSSQAIVRALGPNIYQSDWNRSVGQLPGFQSFQSIMMTQMASNLDLTLVNDINLGTLEQLALIDVDSTSPQTIDINWDPAVTGNGTANDQVVVLAIAKTSANRTNGANIIVDVTAKRSDSFVNVSTFTTGAVIELYIYARGAGTAEGLLSIASHHEIGIL